MKNLILLAIILFGYGSIQAQDIPASSVPAVVKNTLMKTNSNPRDVEWERKGEYYNVEYEIGQNDHELWITASGQLIKHKEDISPAGLPQSIKNRIKTDYKEYRIDDAEKLTIGNKVLYKVEMETGRGDNKVELDLVLDENAKSLDNSAWYEMPSL